MRLASLSRLRLFVAVLLALAAVALVAVATTGAHRAADRADCVQVWSYYPYPHLVWDCGPAGGGGGGSW